MIYRERERERGPNTYYVNELDPFLQSLEESKNTYEGWAFFKDFFFLIWEKNVLPSLSSIIAAFWIINAISFFKIFLIIFATCKFN